MHESDDDAKPRVRERLPYVAPAIEETSDFETLALACAGDPVNCSLSNPGDPLEPSS